MSYKQSMFNYIYPTADNELLLYNSYGGFASLASISATDFDLIVKSLADKNIENNQKFQKLKSLGYFVTSDTDETLLCEQKYMDIVEESTLRLIILPTEKCNFCCKYCYETFEKGKMSSETQDSLIKFVRKNIMKFSSMEVQWFGGEPLEALDVIENLSNAFISICRAAKRNYTSSMTTNGYNLTLDTFKKLYSLKVYNYQITIDGIKPTHDSQRVLRNGNGTFDKIVSNLATIKTNIKSGIPKFTIRTNFTKYIAQYIDEYIDYFSSLFSDDARFSFSFQKAADWGGNRVQNMSDNLIDNDFFMELLNKISQYKNKLDISPHSALMNGKTCVCYANKRYSFVIGSDGTIYKCTGDFKLPQNNIGYLQDGKMIIDSNKHAKWLCRNNRNYKNCDTCFYSGACLVGSCPASFIKEEKTGLCLYEKSFINCYLELFDRRYFNKI